MKEIIRNLCRLIFSGGITVAILSAVCLAYSYNMQEVPSMTGTSLYTSVPDSYRSKMDEGFSWIIADANGYNNLVAYDKVDILIMGGSHIQALQMDPTESVTYKLDNMLSQYHVYNVGAAGHEIDKCAYYLDHACDYFSPKYVIVDLSSPELDEDMMESLLRGIYIPQKSFEPNLLTKIICNYIPASGRIDYQLSMWKNRNRISSTEEMGDDIHKSYDDSKYVDTLGDFLAYLSNIVQKYDTQLILLYHPLNYEVDENGQIDFADETEELEIFQNLCEENGIVFVSTREENIKMFKEKHVVPNGFSNTKLGEGHLNKYGHTAMANVLYETIEELED